MTEIETKILDSLVELENLVKTMPTANRKPNLGRLFEQIDELANRLPSDCDPNLRHYLQRKSYEKARLFLEGRDRDNARGNCGRH